MPRSTPMSDDLLARAAAGPVTAPTVAAYCNGRGDTGPPADLLIGHDVVYRNALHNRVDRFRFPEHFGTCPTDLREPEARFRGRFTPQHSDHRYAKQKKNS